MIVYSNSCSFGQANQGHDIYPELIAHHYNASLINKGVPGSCNRRIIRTSTRDLLDLKSQGHQDILCLIGLSFISRTELWQPDVPATDNDGNFHPISVNFKKFNWTQNLINTYIEEIWKESPATIQEYYKQWLLHMSKEAIVTDLATDIILLKDFCLQNNIKILIWSNTQLWPKEPEVAIFDTFLKDFTKVLLDSKNIIDPWKFSFQQFALDLGHRPKDEDVYGTSGHPSAGAHVDFANYLIEYIKQKEIV